MIMRATAAVLVLLLLVTRSSAQPPIVDLSSTYQFNASLHERYTLYWSFNNDAQTIRFAVRVRTTGWVGFGISPNGQMPQSDVVIGWVDNGRSYFDDRFADTRSLPPVDNQQDWFLTRATEDGGYTILEFNRNYTSCDTARDRNIKHETSRVVWSWNDNDPVDNVPAFHQFMGSTSLNLLGGQTDRPQDPPDAMTLAATVQNITIPSDDTTYWCAGFRIPQTLDATQVYVTKFAPVISPGNEPHVHHLLIYVCDGLDGLDLTTEQGACHTVDWRIRQCTFGGVLIAGWAVGGEAFTYPSNVAYPVGGPGFPRYVVMELHYSNPNMVSGVRDSSGLIFTYTQTRREHNAGIMQVGHSVSFTQIIPPRTQNYSTYGICHSSCTSQQLPADGIRVFGNLLHTHLLGTGLELSVLRENSSLGDNCFDETQLVERNFNYDFNYQQFVHLPKEVSIMPGDTLLLKCIYNSQGRANITVGGLSTQDEMCLSFLAYYPSVNLSICTSLPQYNNYSSFLNRYAPLNLQQQYLAAVRNNALSASVIKEIFNQLPWTPEMVQAFENNLYTSGNQSEFCFSTNRPPTTAISKTPDICNPLTEPKPNVCLDLPGSAATLISHFLMLAGLSFIALLVVMM